MNYEELKVYIENNYNKILCNPFSFGIQFKKMI